MPSDEVTPPWPRQSTTAQYYRYYLLTLCSLPNISPPGICYQFIYGYLTPNDPLVIKLSFCFIVYAFDIRQDHDNEKITTQILFSQTIHKVWKKSILLNEKRN